MTTPWHKAVRDFWQERTRTALVVLAIALGIAGFSAVLSSYAILTRALNEGYLATNPASATIRVDRADAALVSTILADKRVSDAEPRRAVSGKIKGGAPTWKNLTLFVVEDYGRIRVSTLVPEQGAWPPATGEILIERDAFQVAKTKIGDSIRVKTIDGTEQALRVSGSVHDVGQAQARMENAVYGYITLDTLALLGEQRYLDQLKILVADDRFDDTHIKSVVEDLKHTIEQQGHTIRRVDIPEPGKHPHANIMGLLMLSMSTFGLFVLLLSGVIVVNLLTALMAAQVRQIGVMKALGGTRGQIARIYFGQALLLGAAALIIAIPLGMWGARVLCRYQAYFLNFDINSYAVPLWVYALVALVGIVAPLLAAAYPVWKGSGVSVREALADFGVSQTNFGAGVLDRMLANVSGMSRPLLFAIRNSFRRRARTVLTLATIAAGGVFFLSALNVRASIINTLDELFRGRRFDLQAGTGTNTYPFATIQQALAGVPGIRKTEGWFVTDGAFPEPSGTGTQPKRADDHASPPSGTMHGSAATSANVAKFIFIAVPAESDLVKRTLITGRDLLPGEADTVVVNQAAAAKFPQLQLGNAVTFQMGPAMTTWKVVGVARESFSPPVVYVPYRFIDERHPGLVNSLRIALARSDEGSIDAAKSAVDDALMRAGIRATSVGSLKDARFGFDQHIVAAVGGLGLTTTMSLNVLERRREMGVLRAIGATPQMVWLIVVAEGLAIGVLSWLIAVIAAWPISRGVGNLLTKLLFQSGLDFSFEWQGLVIWLAVCVGIGLLASFLPAWHAAKRPVREAVGYE
jgi:putative ABC transport system permease protein